jgi:hypothetical protein
MISKPRKCWVGWSLGIIIFLFLIVSVIIGFRWINHIPSVIKQVNTISGIQTFIVSPGNHTQWPLDAIIPIEVQIQSTKDIQQIDLISNGIQVASQTPSISNESLNLIFNFQANNVEPVTLFLRVIASDQSTRISDPIQLTILEPVGASLELTTTETDTLEGIAEKYNTDPQTIVDDNPKIDFDQPLPANELIHIPIQFPVSTGEIQNTPYTPLVPQIDAQIQQESIMQNLKYYLISQLGIVDLPPNTPTLQATVVDCNVHLVIGDKSANEFGFFVYQTTENSTSLTKIQTLAANPTNEVLSYIDPNQAGNVSYIVGAYNSAGENQSDPVTINISNCSANENTLPELQYNIEVVEGSLSVNNHVIQFQQTIDLAYLYISINNQDWERVPAGNFKFLPGTGNQFILDDYLDDIISDIPDTKLEIELEIWGWNGAALIDCGTVKLTVERTVLSVCGIANIDCGNDFLSTEIIIPPASQLPGLQYQFKWDTADNDNADSAYFQIATHPFTGDEIRQVNGLITSRGYYKGYNEEIPKTLQFNFDYLYNDAPFNSGNWKYGTHLFDSNFFQNVYPYPPKTPFTLYARIVVYDGDGTRISTSNTVLIHNLSNLDPEQKQLYASDLPSLYDIKFLPETYRNPILLRDEKWGCIVLLSDVYYADSTLINFYSHGDINNNDIGADAENCWNPVSSTCNQKNKPLQYAAGTEICPTNYSKPSGFWADLKSLASGIWSGVTGAWDTLIKTFEGVKTDLTEKIASVIPNCGDICKAAIKKGLEAGFTALTGLPPNLPTYEGLKEDGIAYAVELTVEEIGPDCDDTCKAIIEKGIRETIDLAKSNQLTPGCVDSGEAHVHGKEPLCYPSDSRIKWGPAEGAVYQPAVISLQVTRKPMTISLGGSQSPFASPDDTSKYRVWVDTNGFNDTRMGDWFPICGFIEGLDGSNAIGYTESGGGYHTKRQINNPLDGPLYQPLDLHIPWLNYGESVTIPISFEPELFWRLNHLYDLGQTDSSYDVFFQHCGDDWPYLFFGGTSQLNAVEQCINPVGEWVPCTDGGQDLFKTSNPLAP